MASNKILLLLLFITVCTTNASQELENVIVKTDIEAIKKILPNVTLNSETKQSLVDLANDIMLMRLKTEEIYSFKNISNQDEESLEKALSKKTIKDIKQLNNIISFWANAFFLSGITAIISLLITKNAEEIGFTSFFLSLIVMCIAPRGKAHTTKILKSKIRSNLHQLYQDSIEIKHLVANVPI